MERHDAIIIGGGLNGLTAAACLARSGARVLVLERNAELGGAAACHDLAPGFRVPRYSLGLSTMPQRLIADLGLRDHGLRLVRLDGGVSLLPDGRHHAAYRDGIVHRRELARFSSRDADAWTRYRRDMLAAVHRLRPLIDKPMRDPSRRSLANFRWLRGFADGLAAGDVHELHELARLWTLSAADFLDDYFESDIVKARLASVALAGSTLGPRSPTSARFLIAPFMDEAVGPSAGAPAAILPIGGPGAIAHALASVIRAHGGKVRLEAEVTDVLMRERRARGVVLANGEEIEARAIVSDLDLKRSFLALFPWKEFPEGFVEKVGRFRMRGVTAKINLALDAAPDFPAVPSGCPALAGGIRLAQTMRELDRAFDDWRDAVPPSAPTIEALVPTLADPTLAPRGKHVMSVAVHYVPEALHDGPWTGERKDELADLVIARLAEASPGLKERIVALETLVPPDIEAEVGLTSGDLNQGELTLDQMFFNRPMAGVAGYETPIRDFYLCSASVHPGPGALGSAGANAAAVVAASLGTGG